MSEKHILDRFENREATQLLDVRSQGLYPATMDEDYDSEMFLLTEDIVELNERKVFLEGTSAYLGTFEPSDTEGMLQEIRRLYAEKGIELTRTVIEWFRKGSPPSKNHRRNLYDFCYALGMDYQTTAEFFLKVFLTIPYNYKDRVDAIYFYGLKANRPYSVIKKILEDSKAYEATNPDISGTERIGIHILSIDTDEEFLEYLRSNCYDPRHQYSTAKEVFAELLSDNKRIRTNSPQEIDQSSKPKSQRAKKGKQDSSSNRNPEAHGNAELLNQILGYSYQRLSAEQKANLDNCDLPRFPTDVDISSILSPSKSVSSETLRKALILMKFYNYFRLKQMSPNYSSEDIDDIRACYDDFLEETNYMLAKCGFVQMYLRNPYDWIILFCAYSQDPLFYLVNFIEKRYFGQTDV